ncbi:MAG TPA: AAA family ATPase [Clostridiales bacterium]|jgi:chloramphenicol 3-O-phosphotransferase|nr:AAA family ATPase [Clostridiales bacterium]
MKNLIVINGTMGVGKTATSRALQSLLPNCVFLDGDWCWDMSPFIVNKETKEMVLDNISHLLNNFIACSVYENIVFCWVMHEQGILDDILSRLNTQHCKVFKFSLICSEEALIARLTKDVRQGIRTKDVIERSVPRLPNYFSMDTEIMDVSEISAQKAAKIIAERVMS